MNKEKWRLVCVEFTNGVRGLLVVNDKNKVVSGGGFEHKEDADTAASLVGTLMCRLGLGKKPPEELPPTVDLQVFLDALDEQARRDVNTKDYDARKFV